MGNGDGWPEEPGPPDGLPDLPPDWGPVFVPDDASELAAEAAALRRELRRDARRATWRRWFGLPARERRTPPLRLPLMLVSVAVLATLTSLFAVVWPGPQRPPTAPRPTTSSAPGSPPRDVAGTMLPALDVLGETGGPVPLRGLLPAVIILIDACACPEQVEAVARVAPAGVTVVALSRTRVPGPRGTPLRATGSQPVRDLADPTGELRAFLRTPPRPGTAGALLVARSGRIVRSVPEVTSVADLQTALPQLVPS